MEDSQEEMSKMSLDSDKTDRTENSRTEVSYHVFSTVFHHLDHLY